MTQHPRIVVRALTWNLFHGRDFPPDRALFTVRSRLARITETNATHAQVNRSLRPEFTAVIASLHWDFALLQEAPPRWLRPLCRDLGAAGASALTARNALAPVRALAAAVNPDLVASNEGGSNQLLVRAPWRIEAVRRSTLTRRPERRTMLWARIAASDGRRLCVAGLHASTGPQRQTAEELLAAAACASAWSEGLPLVLGGDFNLAPADAPDPFAALEADFSLTAPTAPEAIDHLLVRGLEPLEPAAALPAEAREISGHRGLRLRLSDHPCVTAAWGME
ncbi:MAG: hypothetical protein NVS2B9_21980 [Myxococcales bacterium]